MLKKFFIALIAIICIGLGVIALKIPGGLPGAWVMVSAISGLNKVEASAELSETSLKTPYGFAVNLFADNLNGPRFMLVSEAQDIIVSLTGAGQIAVLKDRDNDGIAEITQVLISDLQDPQGLVFDGDWLYFSERHQVSKVRFDHQAGATIGQSEVVVADLPFGHPHRTHNAKALGISPDRKLHINVGSPCNNCEPEDPRYSAMLRAELDGSDISIYATGLRNSVGFDWAPWSGELFATVNARDMLGDAFPPDELNLITEGGFYGWPYYHGDNVPDPELGDKRPDLLASAIKPAFNFQPHNAPLGIHFLNNTGSLPEQFKRSALVALHGSWNRSSLDGYKVIALHWNDQGEIHNSDFMHGFLSPKGVIGRPVDIAEDSSGDIYISDDLAGRVYRVSYKSD
jgi:glucose/arabinose dehydrogenase